MGIWVEWNWTAISSVATSSAVLVALFPIVRNAFRQRKLAKILLVQIQTQLTRLRPTVARRLGDTDFAAYTAERFSPEERKSVDALELLFGQAHIMKPREYIQFVLLAIYLPLLSALPEFGPSRSNVVSVVLAVIEESLRLFGESKILHGKGPDLPWDTPKKTGK